MVLVPCTALVEAAKRFSRLRQRDRTPYDTNESDPKNNLQDSVLLSHDKRTPPPRSQHEQYASSKITIDRPQEEQEEKA